MAATGPKGQVKIWQKKDGTWVTGKKIRPMRYSTTVTSITFSPDSNILIAGNTNGEITMWDTNTSEQQPVYRTLYKDKIRKVIFDSEGKRFVIASLGGGITLLQDHALEGFLAQVSDKQITNDRIQRLAISPDGKIEAIVDSAKGYDIILKSTITGKEIGEMLSSHQSEPNLAAFNANGSKFISVDRDNNVIIWQLGKEGIQQEPAELIPESVSSIAVSASGAKFALGTSSGYTFIYHTNESNTGMYELEESHQGEVSTMAFNDDGQLLATGGTDSTIRIWKIGDDTSNLQQLFTGNHPVLSLAFSPDSKKLASSDYDKGLYLWDIKTGKQEIALSGHQDSVSSILFINEGRNLASASFDNTIRIWDLDIESWLRQACASAKRQLRPNEVKEYVKRPKSWCERNLSKNPN